MEGRFRKSIAEKWFNQDFDIFLNTLNIRSISGLFSYDYPQYFLMLNGFNFYKIQSGGQGSYIQFFW